MKFIAPTVEILAQGSGLTGIKKQIELAGRTAYKSEDKITDTSYEAFVEMLTRRKHGAALEHGTVYLYVHDVVDTSPWDFYKTNKFSQHYQEQVENNKGDGIYHYDVYVTTNYRVLVDNQRLGDLAYLAEYVPGKHTKRITARFTLSRAVANEFVRHRVFSFLQESTRFCNYGKKGGEVTYILPSCFGKQSPEIRVGVDYFRGYRHDDVILYKSKADDHTYTVHEGTPEHAYLEALITAEESYLFLTQKVGMKPQFARDILPLGLKTELIMTGTVEQWLGFFSLRCAPDAHPDARFLADTLRGLMYDHGYIETDGVNKD